MRSRVGLSILLFDLVNTRLRLLLFNMEGKKTKAIGGAENTSFETNEYLGKSKLDAKHMGFFFVCLFPRKANHGSQRQYTSKF